MSTSGVKLEDQKAVPVPVCPVEVRQLQPGEENSWDEYVQAAESGSLFHLSTWARAVQREFGRRSYALVARRGQQISGVLPLSLVSSRIFGNCLVSSPLAVYGGVCASDRESHDVLLQAGGELGRKLNVKYLEMRNRTEPYPTDLPGRDLYVTFTQDLSPGPVKLLAGLPRDTRYAVRKSAKGGLEWVQNLELPVFYEIYARSVHRLGTPVFSRRLFDTLQSSFPGQCRIFGVRKGQTVIAAVFCLYFRDQVLPYYGGALAEFYKDSPNNFMYWNLIEQSCREGYRTFDFGRSKKGTGSFEFKSAWNMQVSELPYRYLLVGAKEVPQMSPLDKKFQLPVEAWKRMPFSLTKIFGPQLIRRIPSI
ncbi:MAG: FemAB family XrtA/PEP-CTERM system-associated protein [Candidatus Solibacter sp.]